MSVTVSAQTIVGQNNKIKMTEIVKLRVGIVIFHGHRHDPYL